MIDADRCWCVLLKWNHTITGAYQIRALIKMGGCQVMTPRRQVESFPSSSAAVAFVAYGHGFRFALDISMCQFSGRWKTCLQPENPTTPVNIIMLLYNTLYYIEVCVWLVYHGFGYLLGQFLTLCTKRETNLWHDHVIWLPAKI